MTKAVKYKYKNIYKKYKSLYSVGYFDNTLC